MDAPKKIVFATFAEHGQSSIILATALEILSRPILIHIHVASFPSLQKHFESLTSGARASAKLGNPASTITFHPIDGIGHFEGYEKAGISNAAMRHPPATESNLLLENMMSMLSPWGGEDYMASIQCSTLYICLRTCIGFIWKLQDDFIRYTADRNCYRQFFPSIHGCLPCSAVQVYDIQRNGTPSLS